MDYIEKARRVITDEIREIERLHNRIDDSFRQAIDLLLDRLGRKGKIVIAGVGKSGNIGQKLAATFSSTGAPSTILNCQDALHGDLGMVSEDDVIIALSYSGATKELLELIPHLKRVGAAIIAITGKSDSSLAKHAEVVLNVEVEREACPLNLAPTSSTTNTLVMGDALAMVLLEARGFQADDFAKLHPGGTLGHALLTKASDLMRTGEDVVKVAPDETVLSVIKQMTSARSGAVVITDKEGKLVGIFTQGDLARAFQEGKSDFSTTAVSELMTPNPIHVRDNKLAGEVLHLLEQKRIDDLVVVDSEEIVVGMIDTQDLSRLRVV